MILHWMIWLFEFYHKFILCYRYDFRIFFTVSFLEVYKASQQCSFKLFGFFIFLLIGFSLRKTSLKCFLIAGLLNLSFAFCVITAFCSYLEGSIHCP